MGGLLQWLASCRSFRVRFRKRAPTSTTTRSTPATAWSRAASRRSGSRPRYCTVSRASCRAPDRAERRRSLSHRAVAAGDAGQGLRQDFRTHQLGSAQPCRSCGSGERCLAAGQGRCGDPLGALGNLSFRQLLTLSQASENLQPKGSTKAPSTTDAAGAALASIYQQQFKISIDAAGKDPAKQQAAVDAFEKKMLPIALKGNTADEYLYGSQ
jgi:hypothetical protein